VRTRIVSNWPRQRAPAITPGTLYLSTQARPGQPGGECARPHRHGPLYNAKGAMIAQDLARLHGDTLEMARFGNNITKASDLTEKGEMVPGLNEARESTRSRVGIHPDASALQPP